MNKPKALFFALTLSFGCSLLTTLPAGAVEETINEEVTVTDSEDPSSSNYVEIFSEDGSAVTTSETDPSMSFDAECDDLDSENCQANSETDSEFDNSKLNDAELENALDEGLADEPEVICATEDEEDCEEEGDPEIWPLYVSLGALGATIVLVIIINLMGRKHQ